MQKSILRIALATSLILAIPLVVMQASNEWNWSPFDFALMGTLLFGAGMTYELVAKRGGGTYRAATGLAVATSLILIWVNAAVGIIGDGPVNAMYIGVIVIGIVGAVIARLTPHGMARALFAMALAQLAVPVLALAIWNPPFDPGIAPVFALNAVFAALFVGAGVLFRRASDG